MAATFHVLLVCRANVCRSPLAEVLVRERLEAAGLAALVAADSAGTDVEPGLSVCDQAVAWLGDRATAPGSRELRAEQLTEADLVLAADRDNRAACAQLAPRCRSRLFTMNQGAFLASAVSAGLADGQLPPAARIPPADPVQRLRWLVGEMDACRYLMSGHAEDFDDIDDRHGEAGHGAVFDEVDAFAATLVSALAVAVSSASI